MNPRREIGEDPGARGADASTAHDAVEAADVAVFLGFADAMLGRVQPPQSVEGIGVEEKPHPTNPIHKIVAAGRRLLRGMSAEL